MGDHNLLHGAKLRRVEEVPSLLHLLPDGKIEQFRFREDGIMQVGSADEATAAVVAVCVIAAS